MNCNVLHATSALYCANHELKCPLEYLSRLNPHASAQNKDAKSHKTTKRYMPVEKSSASKKPERQIPTGHRFSNKKTTTVPEKTMNPRSCLRWQLTGRILKTVGHRWVPTGKLFNSCTSKVESEPTHGSNVDIHHIHACKQTLNLSAGISFNGQKQQRIDLNEDALYNEKQENLRVWLLKLLISKKPVPECSGLVLHQMISDHNCSELGIHNHSNEQSSSKLVPKVIEPDQGGLTGVIISDNSNDPLLELPEFPPPEPPDVEISLISEPDAPVINNVDELNEDECFDPGGSENNVEVDISFTFVTWIFLPFLTYPKVSPLLSSTKNEDTIFDPGIFT
ncbi:hypothetical protein Tco_0727172 [Tanacetum coccineum]|uniref:Uncharacterized protein n=1 Tax=Tanacetum coccineum TaxID=301880 RepID=A0ABQ4YIP4_9ASTR